jgi:hypothetical protein
MGGQAIMRKRKEAQSQRERGERERERVEAGTEEQADVSCNRPEASHPLSLSPSSDVMPMLSSLLFTCLFTCKPQGFGEIQERRERILKDRK